MRFTVFAFSPVPDIATARDNFLLDDLSEEDVAKVLYHQRKQKTGHSEQLTWDQLRIASVSLVHYSLDYVETATFGLGKLDEQDLINKYYQALARSGLLVSWAGERRALPLLHFRSMKHRISHKGYWQAKHEGQEIHVDLQQVFGADAQRDPSLNELAARFGYPGMLGLSEDSVWDAHLGDDQEAILKHSDYLALNSYLLALEMFSLQGRMSYADADRARIKLRDHLQQDVQPQARYQDFLAAWRPQA